MTLLMILEKTNKINGNFKFDFLQESVNVQGMNTSFDHYLFRVIGAHKDGNLRDS